MLTEELAEVGIAIPKFIIENVSRAAGGRAGAGQADRAWARSATWTGTPATRRPTRWRPRPSNPGGEAGAGLGLGMGMAHGPADGPAMARRHGHAAARRRRAAQPSTAQPAAAEPPPLPRQTQWYVGVGGQQQGPYDLGGLAEQVARAR